MKKTISINIGGNIFHIEEEGFNKLKSYLDSVYAFFSTFEDSKEITDDIENRIAEKFYGKLKKNKEAISTKQVDELIASMGTVADFEATLDDEPDEKKQKESKKANSKQTKTEESGSQAKKLYRDAKSKALGGVASGIAHYFAIDPMWVRLLWVVFTAAFGIGLIAYIILWIVLPESYELEDRTAYKKLFRNPDNRVLGGVSGGIASYFGIDTVLVRIIFLVGLFIGGSGLILYLILWIITPEAQSVTEKMEMKGEPVTMKGIEKNVKKALKIEDGEESVFVKILLFPFRLIAMVFEGLGKTMGPIMTFVIETVRVVFGAGVLLAGFAFMISLIFILSFMFGLNWNWGNIGHINGFPIADFLVPLGSLAGISAFFVFFIPALGIALLGLSILLKRRIGNAYVALAMVFIWILAIIGSSFSVPRIIGQFSSDDTSEREIIFDVTNATPTLELNKRDWKRREYEGVDLRLRGHEENTYRVVIKTEAWGSSRANARRNAEAVEYNVELRANDLMFDPRLSFPAGSKFRFQKMDVTLYVPYGKEFRMDQDLDKIIVNTLHLNGYYGHQMGGNTWVFTEDGIDCTTCDEDERGRRDYTNYSTHSTQSFDFENFDRVRISDAFQVKIEQGDEYAVQLRGRYRDFDDVSFQQSGDRLTIRSDDEKHSRSSRDVTVYITMPSLKYFRASGECKGYIRDFDNDQIELELSGKTDFSADIDSDRLVIDMSGGATLKLLGDVEKMDVEISGVAYLNSTDLDVNTVTIDASGESKSKIYADDQLTAETSGESRVEYRGTNNVTINEGGNSRVRKN